MSVRRTARDTCYFCGSEGPIETHHIVPQRYDGSDGDKNLVDLCPTCHERLERLYDDRFYTHIEQATAGRHKYNDAIADVHEAMDVNVPELQSAVFSGVDGEEVDALTERQRVAIARDAFLEVRRRTLIEIADTMHPWYEFCPKCNRITPERECSKCGEKTGVEA